MVARGALAVIWELRAALDILPPNAGVLVEDDLGWRYEITRVRAIGTATNDPGLVLTIRQLPTMERYGRR